MDKKSKKIPIYFGDLVIIQTDNMQDVIDEYNIKFDIHEFGAGTFKNILKSGYVQYIIVFNNDDINHGLIAHEAFHVVTYLFNDKLIRIDNDNDEPAAYLLGWIVNECHKFLKIE